MMVGVSGLDAGGQPRMDLPPCRHAGFDPASTFSWNGPSIVVRTKLTKGTKAVTKSDREEAAILDSRRGGGAEGSGVTERDRAGQVIADRA